jgi:hypothetical protein
MIILEWVSGFPTKILYVSAPYATFSAHVLLLELPSEYGTYITKTRIMYFLFFSFSSRFSPFLSRYPFLSISFCFMNLASHFVISSPPPFIVLLSHFYFLLAFSLSSFTCVKPSRFISFFIFVFLIFLGLVALSFLQFSECFHFISSEPR